jgi:hypothetical protein
MDQGVTTTPISDRRQVHKIVDENYPNFLTPQRGQVDQFHQAHGSKSILLSGAKRIPVVSAMKPEALKPSPVVVKHERNNYMRPTEAFQ